MKLKRPIQSHSKVTVARPNAWASFEKELVVPKGRPEGDWKTMEEVTNFMGVDLSTARRKVILQIKKGAMEKTTRLINGHHTSFYRPLSK